MNSHDDTIKKLIQQPIDRRKFLAGAGAAGLGLMTAGGRSALAAGAPKRGGNLRIAILGGSASDTLDPHVVVTQPDNARVFALFEPLVELGGDAKLSNALAESLEPNATATEWTIRLRPGVKFHNGKNVTAADVAFSLKRIANPKTPLPGALTLGALDLNNFKVLDDRTLRIPMTRPFAVLPEAICATQYYAIVPVDFDPKKPVGTGPFKFESFTPGQQSVFSRFDEYWRDGLPYLDTLTVIDSFGSEIAAFNALQGGQVDAFAYAPLALIRQVQSGGPIKTLISEPGQWTPFTMRVDQAPFNNPDVRKAFRLLVDRKQMIQVALSGHGIVGNDVFSPWDPNFDQSLHRERDVDQAKHLLKKAGQENIAVELVTADFANGVTQMAQVFAQQALDVGAKVSVRQVTVDAFYGDQYLKWPFAQDYWSYSPYLTQIAQCNLSTSSFNETHWNDATYTKLYQAAQSEVNISTRVEILHELQKIDFEQGAYIIPSFNSTVDLMSANLNGAVPGRIGFPFGNYSWRSLWLS
jgi:peptide/nickel transport system substrate-binding protein